MSKATTRLGEKIREMRKQQNLTLEALAEKARRRRANTLRFQRRWGANSGAHYKLSAQRYCSSMSRRKGLITLLAVNSNTAFLPSKSKLSL